MPSKSPKAVVFISPGHHGKSKNYSDRGAHAIYHDDEENILIDVWEAHEALDFSQRLIRVLEQDDRVVTFMLSYGEYADRNRFANMQEEKMRLNLTKRSIFVAPHLNAGGGDYSLVIHDKRSSRGKRLANLISQKWREYIEPDLSGYGDDEFEDETIISDFKVWGIGKGDRGFSVIAGTRMPAVILEPIFLDNEEHLMYWMQGGIDVFVDATAEAIIEYLFSEDNRG